MSMKNAISQSLEKQAKVKKLFVMESETDEYVDPEAGGEAGDEPDEQISMEDEVKAHTELLEHAGDIRDAAAENESAVNAVSALNGLASVVSNIEEMTPVQAGIIQVAGDMMVAGTQLDASQVTPSMEDLFENFKKSQFAQRITEVIRKIIAAIKRAWSSIASKMEGFITRMKTVVLGVDKRIKKLKTALDSAGNTYKPGTLTVRLPQTNPDKVEVTSIGDLMSQSKHLHSELFARSKKMLGLVNTVGRAFVAIYENDKYSDEVLTEAANRFAAGWRAADIGITPGKSTTYSQNITKIEANPMVPGYYIQEHVYASSGGLSQKFNTKVGRSGDLQQLLSDAVAASSVRLSSNGATAAETTIQNPTKRDLKDLLTKAEVLNDLLKKHDSFISQTKSEAKGFVDSINASLNGLEKESESNIEMSYKRVLIEKAPAVCNYLTHQNALYFVHAAEALTKLINEFLNITAKGIAAQL